MDESVHLVIANGRVVDGTGERPAFLADVAVSKRSGKIVEVGPGLVAKYPHARIVDAVGKYVTPGFVDIHTHFDAQVFWDPWLSPSTNHGVTTVLFGNCGVGFAPCRPADRGKLLSALEGVEDIPEVVMAEGLQWRWRTFPEYLHALSGLRTAADFLCFLGHVPLRIYVMGADRAHETATAKDLAAMRATVAEAVEAGAAGVSTSRTLLHRDAQSVVIPGTYATRAELVALYAGMADGGGALFEILEDLADMTRELEWIRTLSTAFGIPATIAFPGTSATERRRLCRLLEDANALAGRELITAQSNLRQQGSLQQIGAPYHPLLGHALFQREISHLPVTEQLRRLRDPRVKAAILREPSFFAGKPFAQAMFSPSNLYPMVPPGATDGRPRYERDRNRDTFQALADGLGRDAEDMVYDALADGQVLWSPLTGTSALHDRVELLDHPHVKVGLGDGGAHLRIFQESSAPTYMLEHMVRDRVQGKRLSLHRAVHLMTLDTARVLGLSDRGVVRAGMRADLNVLDMESIHVLAPEFRKDLPAGGSRWFQGAEGYLMTMVKGVPTYERGKPTGALPGGLVRGRLRHSLKGVRVREAIPEAELAGAEPHSTHDVVPDAELTGGASALARAAKANLIAQAGEFLSGQLRAQARQRSRL